MPDANPPLAVRARGLVKRYGETTALAGIDFEVPTGTVTAVLGPNGAGKTTAVRILTTLADADEGEAMVAGFDVRTDPKEVRRRIGLAAQDATVDPLLTGRENLVMLGELHQYRPQGGRRPRADALLEEFSLADAADRVSSGYSGGMRRRLDLAATLVSDPEVLFLDEPTTGLDPRARAELWSVLDTPGRPGHDAPAHHPVPGRGRAPGRRHHRHRPRPDHRPGRRPQAEAGGRRRPPPGRRRRPRPASRTPPASWPRSPALEPRVDVGSPLGHRPDQPGRRRPGRDGQRPRRGGRSPSMTSACASPRWTRCS